ncbi:MAG: homoserine dehydrogenase [Clostridiales bacterium]|nr:homoserine dehydrogenase [Clostridiales bacterium]
MIKKIGVGLLGLGTVGEEVFKLIKGNHLFSNEKLEIEFEIYAIYVKDINKKRNVDVSGIHITSNYEEVVNNPDIHVCIECMGGAGADKTVEIIDAAIRKGKHIIMSSKKCLAYNMNHIIDMANYYNVQLRFEATVGGAIPICRTLMSMSSENKINRMYGVINATTNYVLSLMEKYNIDFDEALNIAKEKGITENDSSEDIDGWDAAYKMKILAGIGMKADINLDEISPVSVSSLVNLKNDNIRIKQIFYVEKSSDNKIMFYVGPAELEKNNVMYNVRENYNIVFVDSSYSGIRAYYGKGAGGKETASAMYEDLLDIYKQCYWFELTDVTTCEKIDINEISNRFEDGE